MCHQAVGLVQAELERRGIRTASITLLPEVTASVGPPRALSVPYPLGYPLGRPDDVELQMSLVRALLALAEEGRSGAKIWTPAPRTSPEAVICVFAKPPVAGEVKTRLAATLGPERAAALARAFLDDTLEAVQSVPWAEAALATTAPFPAPVPTLLQGPGDLGARIERVLRAALERAPAAIAIGADAPALPLRLLEAARSALAVADAVLGPAADGGFYLLALRRCPEGLLAGLPWSAADTCLRTAAQLRAAGLRTVLLEEWFDVDRPEDLERLRAALQAGEVVAPRTAALLERP